MERIGIEVLKKEFEEAMSKIEQSGISKMVRWVVPMGLVAAGMLMVQGCASTPHASGAKEFWSQQDAVKEFVGALRANDVATLNALLGNESEDIISSGDEVADANSREEFLKLYDEKHSIVADGADKATLVVGDKDWPLPIPLVREGLRWRFDGAAGKEEIIDRRIGGNELAAIQVCKAVGDAQKDYAMRAQGYQGMREYAQKFFSDEGTYNGLYWPAAEGRPESPLGDMVAEASDLGYKKSAEGERKPYYGYYYRILTSQGENCADGALDYLVKGKMVLGYAVLAYPADYGNSGIMTFVMNSSGVVYQKDLGEETTKLAEQISSYNPDSTWAKVKE